MIETFFANLYFSEKRKNNLKHLKKIKFQNETV